jgi:hypothetical integral membrane protein (TIGR02206 family)
MDMNSFTTFSMEHWVTIGIIFLWAAIYVVIARSRALGHLVRPFRRTLLIVAVGHELIWIIGAVLLGQWHFTWGVPLQLCDLAIFAMALTLVRHYQWVWELAYFWGLGGSLQAILTPDLKVTFPDFIFIKFFLSHGCTLIGVIFLAVGLRRPIHWKSVVRVFCITNIYGLFVLVFNWIFGTNYMYLLRKPSQPSILDYAGSGPYYYIGLEVALVISLMIYYLPYFLVSVKRRSPL